MAIRSDTTTRNNAKFYHISIYSQCKQLKVNKTRLITVISNAKGVKKVQGQQASRQVRPKALISAEAKKLLYQKYLNSLNDTIVYSIFHDWVCHLATFIIILVQKRWPSDKANHEKCAINYSVSFKELKVFLIKYLLGRASVDIKVFGHTCLLACCF